MCTALRALIALAILVSLAAPAVGAQDSRFILRTQSYEITIRVLCKEGVVDCNDVEYMGVKKKTGATIRLKGEDWIRYCEEDQGDGPGKTPCEHLGYKFKNGGTTYYVEEDGYLDVYQGKKRILHEKGEWDWGQ